MNTSAKSREKIQRLAENRELQRRTLGREQGNALASRQAEDRLPGVEPVSVPVLPFRRPAPK